MSILQTVINAKENIYTKSTIKYEDFSPEHESLDYYAHTFVIKGKKGLFRIAKKTPTKSGWFVTIWKRCSDNIIAPYDEHDNIDFVVIGISDSENVGEFIFPKTILIKKNIFSSNGKEGKRAIRVYTPWDKTTNDQSKKTQKWQSQFFIDLNYCCSESSLKIDTLYSI